jgi:hypothetical protein
VVCTVASPQLREYLVVEHRHDRRDEDSREGRSGDVVEVGGEEAERQQNHST